METFGNGRLKTQNKAIEANTLQDLSRYDLKHNYSNILKTESNIIMPIVILTLHYSNT